MKHYSAHDIQNIAYSKKYKQAKDSDYMSGKKSTKSDIHFATAMTLAFDLTDVLNATPDKLNDIIENIRKKY